MIVWLWLKKAWAWIKENWKAVLLGIFTLGIGLLIGRAARRPQKVVNPELVDAEKTKREAQEEEDRKRLEAKRERDEKLKRIHAEHGDKVHALSKEQTQRAVDLVDDPEALNEYLLSVGKDIRG